MAEKIPVNKRKLIVEILVIAAVIMFPYAVQFFSWLMVQPTGIDPYGDEKVLFRKVEEFDYEGGNREKMLVELNDATRAVGSRPVKYFFNMYAKAKYLCNVSRYAECADVADAAIGYGPTQEYVDEVVKLRDYADDQK